MRKLSIAQDMATYFAEKGYIPSAAEYVRLNDGPYNLQVIKRVCGSWSRMVAITKHHFSSTITVSEVVEPVQAVEQAQPEEEVHVVTAAEALAKLRGTDN